MSELHYPSGTCWTYWSDEGWIHVRVTREGRLLAHAIDRTVEDAHARCLAVLAEQTVTG